MPPARIWLFVVLSWMPLSAFAEDLPIRTVYANMPPYILEKDGRAAGPFLTLLQEASQGLPIAQEPAFMPLPRLLRMVANEKFIIISLARTPEREKLDLVWIDELIHDDLVFATLASGGAIDSYQAARELPRISALNGGAGASLLAEIGFKNVVLANDMRSEASLLKAGRSDAWFEPAQLIRGAWAQLGFPPDQIQFGKPVKPVSLWICATKSVDPDVIETLHQHIEALRKSNRLAALLGQS